MRRARSARLGSAPSSWNQLSCDACSGTRLTSSASASVSFGSRRDARPARIMCASRPVHRSRFAPVVGMPRVSSASVTVASAPPPLASTAISPGVRGSPAIVAPEVRSAWIPVAIELRNAASFARGRFSGPFHSSTLPSCRVFSRAPGTSSATVDGFMSRKIAVNRALVRASGGSELR